MRTRTKLQDAQVALYRYRLARGRYLSDVPYEELCREEIAELMQDAAQIVRHTGFELRLMIRKHRYVWRFVDKV